MNGIEITVIYTDRNGDERHLISAWRAEPHERQFFWNSLEDLNRRAGGKFYATRKLRRWRIWMTAASLLSLKPEYRLVPRWLIPTALKVDFRMATNLRSFQ